MDQSDDCLKLLKWIVLKSAHFTPITLGKVRPRTLYKGYEWNNFKLTNLFVPITLGKFVLPLSFACCGLLFVLWFPLSFSGSDTVFGLWCLFHFSLLLLLILSLNLVICPLQFLPSFAATFGFLLDASCHCLMFCFYLNHWSAKRPVSFFFSAFSTSFIFKPLICKEICFAFFTFYNILHSLLFKPLICKRSVLLFPFYTTFLKVCYLIHWSARDLFDFSIFVLLLFKPLICKEICLFSVL